MQEKLVTKILMKTSVKNSELIFLEGYLWDEDEPKTAFNKAISVSKKKSNVIVRSVLC